MKQIFCRLCADLEGSNTYLDLDTDEELFEDIKTKLSILNVVCNISDHKSYSNTVCFTCYNTLNTACEFIDKVTIAQCEISKLLIEHKDITKINEELDFNIKQEHEENTWCNYPWMCSHCSSVFEDVSQLRKHSIQEHGSCTAFNCADCSETFNSHRKFTDHVRNHRLHLRDYCIYCNVKNTNIQDLQRHETRHEETINICPKCGQIFNDDVPISIWHQHKNDLAPVANNHVEKVIEKSSRRYSVDSLSSLSLDGDDACGHPIPPKEIQINTWDDYPWICRVCEVAFNTVALLRTHVKTTHNRCFALKCLDCMYWFGESSFDAFLQHVGNHRRSLCKVCFYCRQELPTITELCIHLREKHYKVTLYCKKCGETFKSKKEQRKHLPYMLPKKVIRKKEKTSVKDTTCRICSKRFSSTNTLKIHTEKIHLKMIKFTCEQCGSSFYTESDFKRHISVEHDKKRFKCKLCAKSFKKIHNLRLHIRRHSSEKPFSCKDCGKSFKFKSLLNNHQTIHSEVKPFKCQQCDKSFRLIGFLRDHEIIHTGLKPFSCKICNAAYASRENCYNHMKKKHNIEGKKYNMEVEFDEVAKKWKKSVFKKIERNRKVVLSD